jgi:hypothetical protein
VLPGEADTEGDGARPSQEVRARPTKRITSTDLQGDIMDLNQARRSSTQGGKSFSKNPAANARGAPAIIEAQFVQDIDNFEGVKNIRNYCISCIRDDGYEFGEKSVGVL